MQRVHPSSELIRLASSWLQAVNDYINGFNLYTYDRDALAVIGSIAFIF